MMNTPIIPSIGRWTKYVIFIASTLQSKMIRSRNSKHIALVLNLQNTVEIWKWVTHV